MIIINNIFVIIVYEGDINRGITVIVIATNFSDIVEANDVIKGSNNNGLVGNNGLTNSSSSRTDEGGNAFLSFKIVDFGLAVAGNEKKSAMVANILGKLSGDTFSINLDVSNLFLCVQVPLRNLSAAELLSVQSAGKHLITMDGHGQHSTSVKFCQLAHSFRISSIQ